MKKSRRGIKRHHIKYGSLILICLLIVTYVALDLTRPLPTVEASLQPSPVGQTTVLSADWPAAEESAVGVLGYGLVASHGPQQQTPTASVAKVITALAVLSQKPLQLGEQGPLITITPADVAIYQSFIAEDGSVVQVQVGEQISEYQVLQAMLLPSANNMAVTLANWAFGSTSSFSTYANKFVASLGAAHTTITDPSGFAPSTLSTASDLVLIGAAALNNPVVAQIVAESSAELPVVGTVYNVDSVLGQDNLIGIKTGNTDQAGGCFLAAAKFPTSNGQDITVVTAVMNTPTLQLALNETLPFMSSIKDQVQSKSIPAGFVAARYTTKWGDQINAVTQTSLATPYIPGMPISYQANSVALQPSKLAGSTAGNVVLGIGGGTSTSKLVLSQKLSGPSIIWRLLHPKYIFS